MMNSKTWEIIQGDALTTLAAMPAESVQCVVTSPPYYGLRDYGVEGQLGQESRPDCLGWATGEKCGECFICRMVAIFAEVRRVLRADGVCWLNIGDTYSNVGKHGGSKGHSKQLTNKGSIRRSQRTTKDIGAKPKDMLLIPARLALALQMDGWYVRSDVIWHKRAPMPESVTDRPTKSHEHIYLLSKNQHYYYDADAVREPAQDWGTRDRSNGKYHNEGTGLTPHRGLSGGGFSRKYAEAQPDHGAMNLERPQVPGRNLRDVWSLGSFAFPDAHFATFPPELPERCITAGTSEYGCCPKCAAPYRREIERNLVPGPKGVKNPVIDERDFSADKNDQGSNRAKDGHKPGWISANRTIGWKATCTCDAGAPVSCVVLDPFSGAGTTGMVARRLGRRYIGIELSRKYVALSEQRIANDVGLTADEAEGREVSQPTPMRLFA
jgi:DNA modification methylase